VSKYTSALQGHETMPPDKRDHAHMPIPC